MVKCDFFKRVSFSPTSSVFFSFLLSYWDFFSANGSHKFEREVDEGGDIDRLQFDLHNCQFAAQNYKETPRQSPDFLPSTSSTFMAPTNIFE